MLGGQVRVNGPFSVCALLWVSGRFRTVVTSFPDDHARTGRGRCVVVRRRSRRRVRGTVRHCVLPRSEVNPPSLTTRDPRRSPAIFQALRHPENRTQNPPSIQSSSQLVWFPAGTTVELWPPAGSRSAASKTHQEKHASMYPFWRHK